MPAARLALQHWGPAAVPVPCSSWWNIERQLAGFHLLLLIQILRSKDVNFGCNPCRSLVLSNLAGRGAEPAAILKLIELRADVNTPGQVELRGPRAIWRSGKNALEQPGHALAGQSQRP